MTSYIQTGNSINTVLSNDVKGGDVVYIGQIVGIAATDGDGENLKAVSTYGVYEIPKAAGSVNQGDQLYFDSTAKQATTVEATNKILGVAWSNANDNDSFVHVKIG